MSEQYQCPCTDVCPLQQAMHAIGGKWKIPLLCALASEKRRSNDTESFSHRYNDLLKKVPGISNTMLAKSLKELEADGLITRKEYIEIPIRVEYSLTEKALALQPILENLARWQMEQAPGRELSRK